jgi:hypothetical protein
MISKEQYNIYHDRFSEYKGADPQNYIVIQCRGEFPYATIYLTKMEALEFLEDFKKSLEEWKET